MSIKINWTEKMKFEGEQNGDVVRMDAKTPIGDSRGYTPKELVVLGAAGCSAMDVAALMKKHKQEMTAFSVETDYQLTKTNPSIFSELRITYDLAGKIDPALALEAARLSQTKYCGVSAMISVTCPIFYKVIVNGEQVGEGKSEFNLKEIVG